MNPYLQKPTVNKQEIVIQYASLVKRIANKMSARVPQNIERDDLIQAGMQGLLEAASKFDDSKGVKFSTFAEFRIRGAMLDDLRKKDWIPRRVREMSQKLTKAYNRLHAKNIDNPTDKQLANELEIPLQELSSFLDTARPIPLLSLDNVHSDRYGDESMDFLETLSKEEEESPVDILIQEERITLLQKAIERLPEKEQMVLSLYYNQDLNLKEISLVLGVTESRISQLRTKAVAMLRSYMEGQGLDFNLG